MKKDQIIFLIGRVLYKADKFSDPGNEGPSNSRAGRFARRDSRRPDVPRAETMTEIARIIGKDKSTITALMNKLTAGLCGKTETRGR